MFGKGVGDIRFSRNDLHTVGTTSQRCLAVYPHSKKGRQKVAVGDASGAAVVFSTGKHHEVKVDFTTPTLPKPISSLSLYQDQLFTINGARVNAYSKKGKCFFGFDSNLTETVRSLCVETPYIYCAGEYVMTTFQEATEVGFYMAPDRIRDLLALPCTSEPGARCDAYLACQDRYLRVVRDKKQIAEGHCEAPLTVLAWAQCPTDPKRRDVLYGTSAGSVGAFTTVVGGGGELTRKFSWMPEGREAPVTAITSCDVAGDGVPHIVIGREDGTVEFLVMGASEDGTPVSAAKMHVGESITAVATGAITGTERDEIVLSTYTGKIISFSRNAEEERLAAVVPNVMQRKVDLTEAKPAPAPPKAADPDERAGAQEVLTAKIAEVQKELAQLRDQVAMRRTEYSTMVNGESAPAGKAAVAVASEFHVRCTWDLASGAALKLALEVDAPLDTVCLRSDVALDLLDDESGGGGEAMGVLASATSPQLADPQAKSKLLCVIRPSDSCPTRIEASFRPLEGVKGELSVFVTPKLEPRTAQVRTLPIRPLCLHQRIVGNEVDWEKLPCSRLKMTGPFTARDVHAWILALLPGVPEMLAADSGSLYFKNTFVGTHLFVRYGKGEAEFRSENITTLAIIKESITREATARKIAVRLASEPLPESMLATLKLLHPLMGHQLRVGRQVKVLDALREIEGQEDDTSFLSPAHREILANGPTIHREMKTQPRRLEYLCGLIRRLYHDRAMFLGETVPTAKAAELDHLLERYGDAEIDAFFTKDPPATVAGTAATSGVLGGSHGNNTLRL